MNEAPVDTDSSKVDVPAVQVEAVNEAESVNESSASEK
jgi:hypothetical protein